MQVQGCYGISLSGGTVETFGWGDADGDLDLDAFLPYEGSTWYLKNLGANDPNCDPNGSESPAIYRLTQVDPNTFGLGMTGLVHPEGFQFRDLDRDGDLDAVYNHRVYQNNTTTPDSPSFSRLEPNDSGFDNLTTKDEGLTVEDVDMDGDDDIIRTSLNGAGYVNANRGDGTFSPKVSVNLNETPRGWGAATGDLDNDGDLDLMIGGWFVRNTTVETTSLSAACLSGSCLAPTTCLFNDGDCSLYDNMLPGIADPDRDGDLDVAQVFSFNAPHRLLRNRLYGENCLEPGKRYIKVRPVRALPEGVEGPNGRDFAENEFGARVEIVLRNNPIEETRLLRRVQSTTSAGGYLNQHEYLLHFGLPPDPDPNDPDEDLRFDVYVDFPGRSNQPYTRVDWTVNAQLSGGAGFPGLNLADLYVDPNDPNTFGRVITVYRDGRVRFKSADPNSAAVDDPNATKLYALGGPLRLPQQNAGGGPNCPSLPCLSTGSVLAGLRFTKASLGADPNGVPLRVREIIIDGILDQTTYGCDYNVVVLDVTDPNNPQPIGRLKAYTSGQNNRTFIPVPPDPNDPNAFVIPNDPNVTRTYDVRVRLTSYRANTLSDLSGLQTPLGVVISGGLQSISSASNDICTKVMALQFAGGSYTSPVKVRLSRKEN